jgi:hypothetical protein
MKAYWRSGGTAPRILTSVLDGYGQLHVPAGLPQRNSPWYPLDRRLGGPESLSGRVGEEKKFQAHAGTRSPIIQPLTQRYTTELSRLL